MKEEREGFLRVRSCSASDGEDFEELYRITPWGVGGTADFLDKANRIADQMVESGPATLRTRIATQLRHDADIVQQAIDAGADDEVLYSAICAALRYGRLVDELLEDEQRSGRITVGKYFAANKTAKTKSKLAESLGVSPQALLKFEKENGLFKARKPGRRAK